MFNRRIGGREDRAFQLRALGFPPRLTGRGIAAARRTPEEQRVLYLSYRMDRWDAVTMPVAVLDRVARAVKNAYDELKEARIIARSRAETTVSSPVAARSPAVSPLWDGPDLATIARRSGTQTGGHHCEYRFIRARPPTEPTDSPKGQPPKSR